MRHLLLRRGWRSSSRDFDFFFHRKLLLVGSNLLSTQTVLLLACLEKTGSRNVHICTIEGRTTKSIQNLLCLLVIILNEGLYLIFKPFAEVIEVFMCHELIAIGAPFWIKP